MCSIFHWIEDRKNSLVILNIIWLIFIRCLQLRGFVFWTTLLLEDVGSVVAIFMAARADCNKFCNSFSASNFSLF